MGGRGARTGDGEIESIGAKYGTPDASARTISATASSGASVFKPGIAAGVSLAALAGMTLGSRAFPDVRVALVCVGCLMLAAMGAGAANTVLDSRLDRMMPRVGRRVEALARFGAGPVMAVSIALTACSIFFSYRLFGILTAALILAAVFSYTVVYTLYLKRRSPYGTVPGGVPGALPVLIGYSAASPHIGMDGLSLFAVMLLWQPPHFLALALKYGPEYKTAGIPVMPVALGEPFTKLFMFIYLTSLVPASISLWWFGYTSVYFAVFACALGLCYATACYINVIRSERYGRAFAASIVYILALLAGVIADVAIFPA